jgi:hypothetical protein
MSFQANAVSTAGITLKYASGTTRPTTGYTVIPGVKSIPAAFNEPNALQSTDLSAEKNHSYIPGLSDSGGSLAVTVNDYLQFRTAWTTCVAAYNALEGADNKMWFEIAYNEDSGLESFYFPGEPLPLGFGGAEVDSVLENNANIMPTGDYLFAAAST